MSDTIGFLDDLITATTRLHDKLDSRLQVLETPANLSSIGCRVYNSTAQAIPNATATALAFDSERFDTDTIHDTVTNNTRLTCKTAGVYVISASVIFDVNSTGARSCTIMINGTTAIANQRAAAVVGDRVALTTTTIYQLAVNDYVEAYVLQTSGGNLNVLNIGNFSPEFSMIRVA